MSSIELVVVDLDGTLLNHEHQMSERVEKALKAVAEKGIQVVIATGKTRYSAREVIERLGLQTPGIYVQGLIVYDGAGTITHQSTLDPMVARQVITYAEDRGYDLMIYSGTRILVKSEFAKATELTVHYGEPAPEAIGPLQNILSEMPINKIIAVKAGDPRRIKALRWQLGMQLDGKGRLVQAMIPDMLEILPPNVSKGTALKMVMKDLKIKTENVLAIGDGENDIEMLQTAGIGVAVGNADEKLKAVADHVVGTNAEDGVAEAIEMFVLGHSLDEAEEETTDAAEESTTADETETEKETSE